MSLFLSKITKIFQNQNLTKQGNHYKDETFRFKKDDTPDLYKYNCFISTKSFKRTYELFEGIFSYIWTEKWFEKIENGNGDLKNDSFFKFEITKNDIKNAYNDVYKNIIGGIKSQIVWENDWQNILKNNKNSLSNENKEKIFKKIYMNKYNDENRIKDMLEEYAKVFTFKRLKDYDYYQKDKFKIFEDKISCNNIHQGSLGTCYFLEALSVLSNYGELLYQLFPKENINEEGLYQICLYHEGEWQKVLIDDYFIFKKNYLNKEIFAFARPENDYCLYPCFLEKAYAKILGSYADVNGGFAHDAFKALTGFDSIIILNSNYSDIIYDFIGKKLDEGNLAACSTIGHAYSLLSITSEEDLINKEKKYEFKTRNPWGYLSKEEIKYGNKKTYDTGEMFLIKDKTKDEFKDYFKGRITVCQTLFGSTVYNFKLNDKTPDENYFYFEIYKNAKFYIGIYNEYHEGLFSKIKVSYKDLNKSNEGYKPIEIDVKEKQEIISKVNGNFFPNGKKYRNEDRYYKYIDLEKSKYILKVLNTSKESLNNNILKIIIEGNIYIDYLGNKEDIKHPRNNLIEINKYNYGVKTGELFNNYKILKLIEKNLGLNLNNKIKNIAHGYYVETIQTNEVKTLILLDKNKSLPDIVSEDILNNIFITGHEHNKGKIIKTAKIYNNKLEFVSEGQFINNKFVCFYFDIKNANKNLFNNFFNFNKNSYTKSILHEHDLKYKESKGDWICDFCEKNYKKYDDSFGCRKEGCNYDICKKCLIDMTGLNENENNEMNKNIEKYKKLKDNKNMQKNITFNKSGLYLKCLYHNHELKFIKNNYFNNNCSKCDKQIKGNLFKCPENNCENLDIYLCDECLLNQDTEKNYLITQFSNSIFKFNFNSKNNINNNTFNIYGFFIKGINNNNEISLYINNYINLKLNNDDYLEIFFINKEKIKIYLNNIKRYYTHFDDNYTIFILNKNLFNNYSINFFEYDDDIINNSNKNINDYKNEIIILPSINNNNNNKIELFLENIETELNNNNDFNKKYFSIKKYEQIKIIKGLPILLQKNKKIIGTYIPYQNSGIIGHYGSYISQQINLLNKDFKKYNKIMINILEKEYGNESCENDVIYYTIFFDGKRCIGRYDKNKKEEIIISHEIYDSNNDIYFVGKEHSKGKIKGCYGKCFKYDNNNIKLLKSGFIWENKFFYAYGCFDPKDESNKLYLTMPNLFDLNSYTHSKSFLHQCELKYKSTEVDWICDFCDKHFKGIDVSFGCRKCDFDLCPECLFENENKEKNKIYISLKNSNYNIIKFNKNKFIIKSNYHEHELIFNSSFISQCFKCEKKYYNNFSCENCKISFCKNCIINELENISILKTNLNNCIFRIKKNDNTYIYGYFLKGLNENDLYILINGTYENMQSSINNNFLDIILLNNKKIKINLNEIKNYYIFNKYNYFIINMNQNHFKNNNIFSIEYDDSNSEQIIKEGKTFYGKMPMSVVYWDENDIINLIVGFKFKDKNSNKNERSIKQLGWPILLLKNNKLTGTFAKDLFNNYFQYWVVMPKFNILLKNKYEKIKKIFIKEFNVNINYYKSINSNNYYDYTIKIIFESWYSELITIIRYDKKRNIEEIVSHEIDDIYFVGKEHSKGKIKGCYGKCFKYDNNNIKLLKSGFIWENKFFYAYGCFDPKDESNKLYLTMPNLFDLNSYTHSKSFLHQCELKYKSTEVDWICDFCDKHFKGIDVSFGCRKCDFDLCPECLFENENKEKNKIYISLKNSNYNIIKFNKNKFIIKSNYHEHELIFNLLSNENINCLKCSRNFSIKVFKCPKCNFYICPECLLNEKEEITNLLNKLNNCFFKLKINNLTKDVYGFITNSNIDDEIKLIISESYENIKIYIEEDFFEIILLNNKKLKIALKYLKRYYLYSCDTNFVVQTDLIFDKIIIYNQNIDLIDYIDNDVINKIEDYENKLILSPYINNINKQLKLDFYIIAKNDNDEYIFKSCEKINKNENKIKTFPIIIWNQNKNQYRTIKINFNNNKNKINIHFLKSKIVNVNEYICSIHCFLNLRPNNKYKERINIIYDNNPGFFYVEPINQDYYKAQIEIKNVIIESSNIPMNKIIKTVNLPISNVCKVFKKIFILDHKLPLYFRFSVIRCLPNDYPSVDKNYSFLINYEGKSMKIRFACPAKISPLGTIVEGRGVFI